MHEYLRSPTILEFRENFFSYLESLGIDSKEKTCGHNVRSTFFTFFRTKEFRESYNNLCEELCSTYKMPIDDFVVQATPTPRVFRPGDHGTSWHTDYWYGHGVTFKTVWIPIKGIVKGATFELVESAECNQKLIDYYSSDPDLLAEDFNLFECNTVSALPDNQSAIIFDSNQLHGSLSNETNHERISFDFRFGSLKDSTSNKDLSSYLVFKNKKLTNNNKHKDYKFLKYIRGSKSLDTSAQHILIEGFCKNREMNVIGQEAEIERYGQPMLLKHINSIKNRKSKFDGIIISTAKLIDTEYIDKVTDSKVPIFCVIENSWFND